MIESKPRSEQRPEDLWDLRSLYNDHQEFAKHLKKFLSKPSETRWKSITDLRGKLHIEAKNIKAVLDQSTNMDRELCKLYTYTFLQHDTDLSNDEWKAFFQQVNLLYQEFFQASSWIEPELLAIDEQKLQQFIEDEALKEYAFYFKTLNHKKEFTLSSDKEELLALSALPLSSPQKAFNLLNNVELPLGQVEDSKGNKYDLTHGTYRLYQRSLDRELRKNSFLGLHQNFKKFENTIGELLLGHVQKHVFEMKARGYKNCLMAALYKKNIPIKTYHNLIHTVRSNLKTLHEYAEVKRELMGLDEIHLYDMQVPFAPQSRKEIPYTQAVEWVIDSVEPLGKEYQKLLAKGLTEQGWVDIYENRHKRSGAYSSGCYDSYPYMLLNYKGTLNDVFTLAHEAGHSMHTLYSQKHQSYLYSRYPIFVAEVASIFNETLLMDYLMKKQDLEEDQLSLLHEKLEEIRGTLFRQTLFAEFELHLHECLESGQPLTAAGISEYYYELNRDYYGPKVALDREIAVEWCRVPHFYSNFYVYQYATGISAALTLAYRVLEKQPGAKEDYLKFLSSGGHAYPLDLLKVAGVDMESTKPIEKALTVFHELVNSLKQVKKITNL